VRSSHGREHSPYPEHFTRPTGQEDRSTVSSKGTPAWIAVERAIADLVENQNIDKRTHTDLIIGYIVNCLIEEATVQTRNDDPTPT
jgi:hypothetical protein